jgi:hypothetical protein
MEDQVLNSTETAVIAPTSVEVSANIQTVAPTKLQQLKATLKQLEILGVEVAQDEITSIKIKIVNEEEKIRVATNVIKDEVIAIEEPFVAKYGMNTVHIVNLVLLAVIAYKLFH